jgi:hypothetical protein
VLVQGATAGNLAVLPMTALTESAGAPAVWVFDPGSGKVAPGMATIAAAAAPVAAAPKKNPRREGLDWLSCMVSPLRV